MRPILVADLLCGAGGSSTGCARALADLGLRMELVCVNHWGVAIETHKRNHPEARHYVQDIAMVRPHLIVPEGYLDLLMASPTCTHHSVARGGKPTSDQQRSDPWHIITWLTELRVKRIIIENVWEFTSWGPVDARTGKPIKSRRGEYFRAWIDTVRRLGFDPEWRKLNAADYGDATTRQRFILMARSDRRTVLWPIPTHHKRDTTGDLALFSTVKPWRPAREIIDWSLKGRSIFARKKPLARKTLDRIYAGAVKFGWPEPFLVVLRNHMAGQTVDGPLPTIAANGGHIGLAQPVVVRTNMHGRKSPGARGSSDPLMTITTDGGIGFAEPFVISPRHGKEGAGPRPRSAGEPLPTITAGGSQVALAQPFIVKQNFKRDVQGVDLPVPTIMTVARVGVAEPVIVRTNIQGSNGAGAGVRGADNPLPTITSARSIAVAQPFILSRRAEGAPRAVGEPMPTNTAQHSPILIAPYYGSGSGESCASAEDPLATVTAKGRFGMVVPITHSDGSERARDVDSDPLPTVTTAHRGELAFIAAQFGERAGQAPRVHSVEDPAPTICAEGHVNLVEATDTYDILFRMLEPHELAAAMGFDTDEQSYEFAGTKTEQIKQIGNAVSVAKMKACVKALMADAAPKVAGIPKIDAEKAA